MKYTVPIVKFDTRGSTMIPLGVLKDAVDDFNKTLQKKRSKGDRCLGEIGKGESSFTVPYTNLTNVSHIIENVKMVDSGDVFADIETLSTPNGKLLDTLLSCENLPDSSLAIRGYSSMGPDGKIRSIKIESFDFVMPFNPKKAELPVTDSAFWDLVKEIDWRNICRKPSFIKAVQKKLKDSYPETLPLYHSKFYALTKALEAQLIRYAKNRYDAFGDGWRDFCTEACGFSDALSSDQRWYICSHIVGCGKEHYDRVMLDPTRICDYRDYKEGFGYCFY